MQSHVQSEHTSIFNTRCMQTKHTSLFNTKCVQREHTSTFNIGTRSRSCLITPEAISEGISFSLTLVTLRRLCLFEIYMNEFVCCVLFLLKALAQNYASEIPSCSFLLLYAVLFSEIIYSAYF